MAAERGAYRRADASSGQEWVLTPEGWFFESDDPLAPIVYHFGAWDFKPWGCIWISAFPMGSLLGRLEKGGGARGLGAAPAGEDRRRSRGPDVVVRADQEVSAIPVGKETLVPKAELAAIHAAASPFPHGANGPSASAIAAATGHPVPITPVANAAARSEGKLSQGERR